VTYDNRPLVADSPLSDPGLTPSITKYEDQFNVLMKLRYSTKATMPTLTFGKRYQFACFAIANSGAIPFGLAKVVAPAPNLVKDPWSLASTIDDAMVSGAGAATRDVHYVRRVRIGSSQITDSIDPRKSLQVPLVQDNVHPRARDLKVFGDSGAESAKVPVILLAPKTWKGGVPSVAGLIRRPGVQWECWHRWVKGSVSDDTVAKIIAEFFRTSNANSKSTSDTGPNAALTIDDPALAPWIYFELQKVGADGSLQPVSKGALWVKVPEDGFADTLASRRAPGIPFSCEYIDLDEQKTRPANQQLIEGIIELAADGKKPAGARILVNKGEVYRLEISCTMTKDSWIRFASGIVAGRLAKNDEDSNTEYCVVSPQYFAIETVTEEMPSKSLVWNSLVVDDSTWQDGRISVGFNSISPHLHRAELTRQVWRWQGRNTAMHPRFMDLAPTDVETRTLEWEAVEFGDRKGIDSTVVPMRVSSVSPGDPTALAGSRSFSYLEVLKTSKGDFDQRSLHFRFAVTVYSRYEGMTPYRVVNSVQGSNTLGAAATGTSVESEWRHGWVPCRRTSDIHAPRVRLILPLTEASSYAPRGSTPGLLVVFDEPWHESGGLAEILDASVALTADPGKDPAVQNNYFFEIGPDPIVSSKIQRTLSQSWDQTTPAGQSAATVPWSPDDRSSGIIGPVGHYFDPTNSAALFTATSFVIPTPRFKEEVDESWYFAKLQFRRRLIRRVHEVSKPSQGKPGRYQILDSVDGPYSDPIWTQFLPPFSIFENTPLLSGSVTFTVDTTRLSIQRDRKPYRLNPMASDNANFSLYAVLTRRVFDIAGRADQEQFLGLFAQDPANSGDGSGWTIVDVATLPATQSSSYRLRIIEVQRPAVPRQAGTDGSPRPVWDELFGGAAATDAGARIVRISQPIDSGVTQVCEGN
jgi:hypothetical protein